MCVVIMQALVHVCDHLGLGFRIRVRVYPNENDHHMNSLCLATE